MNRSFLILFSFILVFSACKSPEARKPVQHNSGTFFAKSIERNKAIFKEEEKLIKQYLSSKNIQSYETSEEGYWYYYIKKDSLPSPTPKFGNHITFRYHVNHLNGTKILTEEETGLQNYIVDQSNQDLIPGIRDGVKQMKEGETVTFLFSSFNAYGYYGIENKIGSNVPIECTITLITIKQTENN